MAFQEGAGFLCGAKTRLWSSARQRSRGPAGRAANPTACCVKKPPFGAGTGRRAASAGRSLELIQPQVVVKNVPGLMTMLLSETGFELVEHLERQEDIPSLLASFQRLVLAYGLDCFCIGDPPIPRCGATIAAGARPGRSSGTGAISSRTI